jgi:putative membrane protein
MRWNRALDGAVAGFTATIPMTVVMLTLHRRGLPERQRYSLPPRRITMRAAGKARVRHWMDESDRTAATYAAHFGYGTATGAVYGALAPAVPGNALVKGTSYGLIVWALSYLGLLPLLDLHRPATREPAERNALMILAHVVWGAALGALTDRIALGNRRLRSVGAR